MTSMLYEPVSLRIAVATSCDAVSSYNRQDIKIKGKMYKSSINSQDILIGLRNAVITKQIFQEVPIR